MPPPLITKPDQYFPLEKRSSVGLPGKETALMIETGGRKTREPFVRSEVIVKGLNVMLRLHLARDLRRDWRCFALFAPQRRLKTFFHKPAAQVPNAPFVACVGFRDFLVRPFRIFRDFILAEFCSLIKRF
jgi:hypothetical protein